MPIEHLTKKVLCILFFLFILLFLTKSSVNATSIGSWQSSTSYANDVSSHPLPSFVAGNYYYVLLYNRSIIYAKLNSNGTLGNWQTASTQHNEGSGRGYTAVVIGNTPFLLRFGRVEKLVIDSSSGNVTAINQVGSDGGGSDSVGGNYYYWNSVVSATIGTSTYVFHLGGFDCCQAPHYSTNNQIFRANNISSGSWQWQSMGNGTYRNPYKGVFYKVTDQNYGYIFASDLNQEKNPNPLYRIKVKSDGNFEGGWTNTGNLPDKASGNDHALGDIFVIDSSLFVVRGSKVYQATINTDGSISSWNDSPPDLPEIQINKPWGPSVDGDHTDGSSYGIYNNYVYVTGPNKVYFAQINGSPIPTLTPTSTQPSLTPTVTNSPPTATPTYSPTSTPTNTPTPYPTTGPARLPKVEPSPYPQGPYCPVNEGCTDKSKGDGNCNGVVDQADYDIWLTQFDTIVPGDRQTPNANYACVEGNSSTYFIDLTDFEVWRRYTIGFTGPTPGETNPSPTPTTSQPTTPSPTTTLPTASPTACPPTITGYEVRPTGISNYCTNAAGITCNPPNSFRNPLHCYNASTGWYPYGPSCTNPNCDDCLCISPTPGVPTATPRPTDRPDDCWRCPGGDCDKCSRSGTREQPGWRWCSGHPNYSDCVNP